MVMLYGLCNAPSTSERIMDTVLEGILGKGYSVCLDDIVVHGQI